MLLRRITEHVRAQNWFAVGLDFLIVVIGVLLAMQISNWNTERLERERGEIYSQRLKAELRLEHEFAKALLAYNKTTLRAGQLAYDGLTEKADIGDEAILINAYRATQYNWFERRRATFDEIVASGSLALIADQALLETALGYYNTELFDLTIQEVQNARFRELLRMTVEPDLHAALGRDCGDREYKGDTAAGLLTLGYACDLDFSEGEIETAVLALRADPEIIRTLRLRNAQTSGRITDIDLVIDVFGLNDLFPELSTP